jgi:hypothetical protein
MDKQFIEAFKGPNGTAELFEVVKTFADRPHVEEVQYEILFKNEPQYRLTIGEASVLACELSGDPRFANERMDIRTGHSNL